MKTLYITRCVVHALLVCYLDCIECQTRNSDHQPRTTPIRSLSRRLNDVYMQYLPIEPPCY